MNKIMTIAFFLLLGLSVNAQFGISSEEYSRQLEEAIRRFEEDPTKENKKKVKKLAGFVFYGGVNFATIFGESESYESLLFGLIFGFQTTLSSPSRPFVVEGGMNFTGSGGKYEERMYEPGGGMGNSTKAKLALNYLNVPLTVKYRKNMTHGFYAEAGLQPGFLLSAKDKQPNDTYDVKEGFNKFDLGVIIGAGYQVNDRIGAGVRVIPGVTNINKEDNYSLKDHNLGVSVRASYRLF